MSNVLMHYTVTTLNIEYNVPLNQGRIVYKRAAN